MSELVTAGAAIGSSLVTGLGTWLMSRSQSASQREDARDARKEEFRRITYTKGAEALTVYMSLLTECGRAGWDGRDGAIETLVTRVAERDATDLYCLAELQLLGPKAISDRFGEAHSLLGALDRKLRDVLSGPAPSDGRGLYDLLSDEVEAASAAMSAYVDEARAALGYD
ncbi:hypothetical protein [Streptomyces sp. NPDC042319]|uniref:hypothetical protein n=1 Tax=Streptomyces sp. NPDC042319 TaxID=3154332 RepID=UPI0033C7AD91